jgi:outer membrane cobalamin receptor
MRVRQGGFRLLRLDAEYAATPRSRWQLIVENALDAPYATVYGYRSPGLAAMVRVTLDR